MEDDFQIYSCCPKNTVLTRPKLWKSASTDWLNGSEKNQLKMLPIKTNVMQFSSSWNQSSFVHHGLRLKVATIPASKHLEVIFDSKRLSATHV